MEVKFDVTISVNLPDRNPRRCKDGGLTSDDVISAFLYDIAGTDRRFRVKKASQLTAIVSGQCTEEEILQLSKQMQTFFTSCGYDDGVDYWKIARGSGQKEAEQHIIEDDGVEACSESRLKVLFCEDWADAQEVPPTQMFFTLLCEKLGMVSDAPVRHPSCLVTLIHTTIPVEQIWDIGQAVLQELGLLPYVIDFSIRMLQRLWPPSIVDDSDDITW